MGLTGIGTSFWLMEATFPAQQSAPDVDGVRNPLKVARRSESMKQHPISNVDRSYIVLNMACMPGLFYHFVCLMRDWGFNPADPPMFGIYPTSPMQLLTETLPEGTAALALYLATYEFVYYW